MLSEINRLFGRDFILGFFFPAIAFIAGSMGEMHAFNIGASWLSISKEDPLKDTTILALVTLSLSLLLMGTNRLVFRTLEGYWPFDIGSHVNHLQLWLFRRLSRRIAELRRDPSDKAAAKYNKLMEKQAMRFPSREDLILCTAFGNSVRAFEDYPRVMYGFESITGWSRISAVLPKEFQATLANMRGGTDMWVNLWFVSTVLTIEFIGIAFHNGSNNLPAHIFWIPATTIVLALLASRQARISAERWGEWVKASFDVFLPELCSKLGYKRLVNPKEEREFWLMFSQAITYRYPDSMDDLAELRINDACATKNPKDEGDNEEEDD